VIIFCFILDKFTLFFSLVNRSNTKVCLRVDECEGSNPSSREESLAGGCTVFNLHVFELIIELFLALLLATIIVYSCHVGKIHL
jgi:hypothetical protein